MSSSERSDTVTLEGPGLGNPLLTLSDVGSDAASCHSLTPSPGCARSICPPHPPLPFDFHTLHLGARGQHDFSNTDPLENHVVFDWTSFLEFMFYALDSP